MKKILLMMLLTFTTMAYADEHEKFKMIHTNNTNYWGESVFVLDTEKGNLRFCHIESEKDAKLVCYDSYGKIKN